MMRRYLTSMYLLWALSPVLGAAVCFLVGSEALKSFDAIRIGSASLLVAIGAATYSFRMTWLPKLKEAYESAEHTENVSELREAGQNVAFYGGFYRLATALSTLTLLTVISALIQLFGGIWRSPLAAGICMGTTIAVMCLFMDLLHRIRRIEVAWIQRLEKDAEAKHQSPPVATAR